jgi:transposase
MDLTDEQWQAIETFIPKPRARPGKKGRPALDRRWVLNGILWILRTGAQWDELPRPKYPPHTSVHRYFQNWTKSGVMDRILRGLAEDLRLRGKIDLSECFIDGSLAGAKKGALAWAPPSGARAAKSWQWQTLMVFLSPCTRPAHLRLK